MCLGNQRPVRLALLGAVVLVHGALIALWWRALPSPRREAPQSASRVTIRLLPWPLPALPPQGPRPSTSAVTPELARRATALRRTTTPGPPSPIPATPRPSIPDQPPATAVSSGPRSAASASAPLDLALPAWHRPPRGAPSRVERALNDARSNTARLTPEQRMNRRFDTTEHVDTLADGSVRTRLGDNCTISRPTRAMQLDPSDPVHNRVAGGGACP